MSDEQTFWTYFFELFEAIPRPGPGMDTMTAKALGCLPPLRADQQILDIGCGPGKQTLELARRCQASILATDVHEPFLKTLDHHLAQAGLAHRVTTQVADMGDLPFANASFDLVWAEGCIFIIGFAKGLAQWKRLIKPGGHLVLSELTCVSNDLPAELREFCFPDSSEDPSLEGRRNAIADAGYTVLHQFPMPREGWWEGYYVPLQEQLDAFERKYAGNPDALAVSQRSRLEIELFLRYEHLYGYTFYVLKA